MCHELKKKKKKKKKKERRRRCANVEEGLIVCQALQLSIFDQKYQNKRKKNNNTTIYKAP